MNEKEYVAWILTQIKNKININSKDIINGIKKHELNLKQTVWELANAKIKMTYIFPEYISSEESKDNFLFYCFYGKNAFI